MERLRDRRRGGTARAEGPGLDRAEHGTGDQTAHGRGAGRVDRADQDHGGEAAEREAGERHQPAQQGRRPGRNPRGQEVVGVRREVVADQRVEPLAGLGPREGDHLAVAAGGGEAGRPVQGAAGAAQDAGGDQDADREAAEVHGRTVPGRADGALTAPGGSRLPPCCTSGCSARSRQPGTGHRWCCRPGRRRSCWRASRSPPARRCASTCSSRTCGPNRPRATPCSRRSPSSGGRSATGSWSAVPAARTCSTCLRTPSTRPARPRWPLRPRRPAPTATPPRPSSRRAGVELFRAEVLAQAGDWAAPYRARLEETRWSLVESRGRGPRRPRRGRRAGARARATGRGAAAARTPVGGARHRALPRWTTGRRARRATVGSAATSSTSSASTPARSCGPWSVRSWCTAATSACRRAEPLVRARERAAAVGAARRPGRRARCSGGPRWRVGWSPCWARPGSARPGWPPRSQRRRAHPAARGWSGSTPWTPART